MVISGVWPPSGPGLGREVRVGNAATLDLEAAHRRPTSGAPNPYLPPAAPQRLEHGGMKLAGAEVARSHGGVTAVPGLAHPVDLHFPPVQTGRGAYDGGADLTSQVEDHRARPASRSSSLHPLKAPRTPE
jgi:hypothetical protein